MTGPAYPEPWLRAWAKVLGQFWGAGPMPRVDVTTLADPATSHRLGTYDPRRHAVTIYDDGDPLESLCTLVHEFAHAWAPEERAHHGAGWQGKYRDLASWFLGVDIHPLAEIRKVVIAAGWDTGADGREPLGRGNRLMMSALDVTVASAMLRAQPSLDVDHVPAEPLRLVATIGPKQHRRYYLPLETLWPAKQIRTPSPSAA